MKPTDVTFKFPLGYSIPQQSHIQVSVADTKKTKPTGVEFPDVPTQALVMTEKQPGSWLQDFLLEVEYTFTTVNPEVFTIQVKAAVGTTVAKAFNDVGDTCQKLCKDYPVTPVTGPASNAQGFFQSVTNDSGLAETQQYFSDIINISFGRDWKAQGGAQEAAKLMVKAGKSFDEKSMATKIQKDWDTMMQKVQVAAAALEKRLKET